MSGSANQCEGAKHWVDIETMVESDAVDVEVAAFRLEQILGNDDRVARLRALRRPG